MRKFILVLALLLAMANAAHATILAVAAEDIDVVATGSVTFSTTSSGTNYRANWPRGTFNIAGGTATDPPSPRITLPSFANQTTIWVHEQIKAASTATTTAEQMIGVFGSDGVRRILVRATGTAGQVKLSTRNTAGTITDLVTCTSGTLPSGALDQVDLFLNYAVSGQVTLYANSVQICTFSGDVTTNSVTAVNQVDLSVAQSGGLTSNLSEVIVADADTRSMGVRTLAPVAAGNTQSWTPNTVGNINPTTINDANFVSTTSNNVLSQWTVGSLPAGTFNVLMVKQSARVIVGVSGPLNFRYSQRVSGSDNNNGSTAGTTSFANYYNYLATSPATGLAWTTSELGAGVNFGLESLP